MMLPVRASAPGKLLLLGEYAVLRGAPALVAAVDRRVNVRLAPSEQWKVSAEELGISSAVLVRSQQRWQPQDPQLGEPLSLVCALLDAFTPAVAGVHITVDSSALFSEGSKLGLGSSAAVASALGYALAALANRPQAPAELWPVVDAAHRAAQGGRGSGADVAASVWGGVVRFQREQLPRAAGLPDGVSVHVVWTGESASTPLLVQRVLAAVDAGGEAAAAMAHMTALADRGARAAQANQGEVFLEVVGDYGRAYGTLGDASGVELLTAPHRRLAQLVESAGGRYKPSGAGGGDVGLAFAPATRSRQMEHAIKSAGFSLLALRVGAAGVRIEA